MTRRKGRYRYFDWKTYDAWFERTFGYAPSYGSGYSYKSETEKVEEVLANAEKEKSNDDQQQAAVSTGVLGEGSECNLRQHQE